MKVIVSWAVDSIADGANRASLADDVEGMRRAQQGIDRGNAVWSSWVALGGGSVINVSGPKGRAEISAEKLGELSKVRDQFASAVGTTASVGVGHKLSEADKALQLAQKRGGDRILLYTQELEQELNAELEQQRAGDPLAELAKADPGMNAGAGAGFQGAMQPATPTVQKPRAEASEHSQGEAATNMMENDNPVPPEMTHSAQDLADMEEQFHDLAGQQDKKDKGDPEAGAAGGDEQLRVQVVQVLQQLKAQMPVLEQVKQTAPDTYNAIMGLAQAVVVMARQMNGDPTQQTGAGEVQDRARSQAQVEVPLPPEASEEGGEGSEKGGGEETKKSERLAKGALALSDSEPGDAPHPHTQTPEFKAWFGASRVVHPETGHPLRVYHGTTHDFTEFSNKKGNPENHYGRGFYFTDDTTDVGQNYAGEGPDLRNRIEDETERLAYHGRKEIPHEQAEAKARQKLVGPGPRTIPAYLRMVNPVEIRPGGGTFYELDEEFDDEGEPTGKQTGNGVKLMNAIRRVAPKYEAHGGPSADDIISHLSEHVPLYEGAWAHDIDEALRTMARNGDYATDNKGRTLHYELIRDIWRAAGHDGIIMNTDRFKNMPGVHGTKHYIVFDPRQIKSAIGNAGTFDPKSKDFGKDELPAAEKCDHDWEEGPEKKPLDKASLNPGAQGVTPTGRHHVVLPVGSKVDPGPTATRRSGRIKVEHREPNGVTKQGWIQARAGQVLSQDGHAISARNPKGR